MSKISSSSHFTESEPLWSKISPTHRKHNLSPPWPEPLSILGNTFCKSSKRSLKGRTVSTPKTFSNVFQPTQESSDFWTAWLTTMRSALNKRNPSNSQTRTSQRKETMQSDNSHRRKSPNLPNNNPTLPNPCPKAKLPLQTCLVSREISESNIFLYLFGWEFKFDKYDNQTWFQLVLFR